MQPNAALWTLDELGARVALALARDYPGQASGRVRDVPDRRTIRYYTTLGLIDRPAGLRGRTALYGPRHLLQLVAVKRLQANGLSLAEIQQRLLGLTEAALGEMARVPADALRPEGFAEDEDASVGRDERFWVAEPGPVSQVPPPAPGRAVPLVAVPLDEGVTLLLEAARPLDSFDLSALREAAGPLLKFLHARRLLGVPPSTQGDTHEANPPDPSRESGASPPG